MFDSASIKFTHLMEWLQDGYNHCQRGSKDWCQSYLTNAHDVIVALEAEAQCDKEYMDNMRSRVAELEAALHPFAEAHPMGNEYVKFHPSLIIAARAALQKKEG